eukprot:529223-Prymnesium_polylepis.1
MCNYTAHPSRVVGVARVGCRPASGVGPRRARGPHQALARVGPRPVPRKSNPSHLTHLSPYHGTHQSACAPHPARTQPAPRERRKLFLSPPPRW